VGQEVAISRVPITSPEDGTLPVVFEKQQKKKNETIALALSLSLTIPPLYRRKKKKHVFSQKKKRTR
jgi:hypothetical protein